MNWLYTWLGLSGTGPVYAWWSGFFGDAAIFGGILMLYRKHNCEVKPCWRIARHTSAAGHHLCRPHHPDGHLTAQAAVDAHNAVTQ